MAKKVWIPVCTECEEESTLELGDNRSIVCSACHHIFDLADAHILYQEFEDIDGVFFKVEDASEDEEEDEEELEEENDGV